MNPLLETPQTLEEFLRRFVYVIEDNMIYDRAMPPSAALMKEREFCRFTVGPMHEVEGPNGGIYQTPMYRMWLNDPAKLRVRSVGYLPGGKQIFQHSDNLLYVNSFTFPEHRAGDPERAKPFFDHLHYLIPEPDRYDLFVDFLAHAVQYPEQRPTFVPLLIARHHGTGRGLVVVTMNEVLGSHNCSTMKIKSLVEGGFQDPLHRRLFCSIHECRAGEKRFTIDDQIRDLLTEQRLDLNVKWGKRLPNEAVYARMFLMSNHPDALIIPREDRRIWVHETIARPKSQDYYEKMYKQLPDLAPDIFAALMARDISAFKHGQRAPVTREKEQMQAFSQNQHEEALMDLVETELPPGIDVMTAGQIQAALSCTGGADAKQIGYALRSHGVMYDPGNTTGKVWWNKDGHRVWILRNTETWRLADNNTIRGGLDLAAEWLQQKTDSRLRRSAAGIAAAMGGNVVRVQ